MCYDNTTQDGVGYITEVILIVMIPTPVLHTSHTSMATSSTPHIMVRGSPALSRKDNHNSSRTHGPGPGVASGTNSSMTRPTGSSACYMLAGSGVVRICIDTHTGNSSNIVVTIQTPCQTIVLTFS